jgi:ferrochelatase
MFTFFVTRFVVRYSANQTKKSAATYAKIWWDEGSPLVVISKNAQNHKKLVDVPVSLYALQIRPCFLDYKNA